MRAGSGRIEPHMTRGVETRSGDPKASSDQVDPVAEEAVGPLEQGVRPRRKIRIDMNLCCRINSGMTFEETVDMAGEPSEEIARGEENGMEYVTYRWAGPREKAYLEVIFSGGKVYLVGCHGLK